MPIKEFVSLRLTRESKEMLDGLKTAFEYCYARKFTFDELMHKLADCVEDGEPGVWEAFCNLLAVKEK